MSVEVHLWWFIPLLIFMGGFTLACLENEGGPLAGGTFLAGCMLIGHFL